MNKEYEYLENCPSCKGGGVSNSAVKKYNKEYEKYSKKLFELSMSIDPDDMVRYSELLTNPPIYPNTNCKTCNGSGKVTRKTSFIQILSDIKNELTKIERKIK